MPRPTDAGNFAESAYLQFPQAIRDLDATNGWALLIFLGAIGQAFQQIDTLAHADGIHDPWTMLLDIDRIPDEGVQWLAQFVGVSVDQSLSIDDQKQQIRDHVGWGRGTPAALKKAVGRYLTGTKTVDIVERDSSPYHFTINTYGDETPAAVALAYSNIYADFATYEAFYEAYGSYEEYWLLNPLHYINDVLIPLNKPAGLQFTFTVTPGSPGTIMTYEAIFLDSPSYETVLEAHQTYEDLLLYP